MKYKIFKIILLLRKNVLHALLQNYNSHWMNSIHMYYRPDESILTEDDQTLPKNSNWLNFTFYDFIGRFKFKRHLAVIKIR